MTTETMTEAEALDAVRRTIAGTVLSFVDPLDARGREDSFLVGDHNAATIMRALSAQGWSWVRRTDAEQWARLRARGRTIVDYHPCPTCGRALVAGLFCRQCDQGEGPHSPPAQPAGTV